IITPVITVPSCSILTATTSKRSATRPTDAGSRWNRARLAVVIGARVEHNGERARLRCRRRSNFRAGRPDELLPPRGPNGPLHTNLATDHDATTSSVERGRWLNAP